MNEFQLIAEVNSILSSEFGSDEIGPGDDSALVSGIEKDQLLLSKDLLVENVHFDFTFSTPNDVGWKSLAVNQSDICAMGGEVVGYLIGICLPPSRLDSVIGVYRGMKEFISSFGGKIYGGDVVSSKDFIISVTAIGKSSAPIRRSGAKVGDSIWVSGEIGLSQIGLELLQDFNLFPNISESSKRLAIEKHRRPIPQIEISKFLATNFISTSMIDISDGLYQDLSHLAKESKKSFSLDLKKVPLNVVGLSIEERLRLFSGGEDFQLGFTVPDSIDTKILTEKFPSCVQIGKVIEEGEDLLLVNEGKNQASLYDFLSSHGLDNLELGFRHF